MLHKLSSIILISSALISCSTPSYNGQETKRSIRSAVEASPTIFGRLFKASKVGAEMSESQAYTILIPPDKVIQNIVQNSGDTLESFASSLRGRELVRSHVLTKEVDINVSNTYTNLLGKQVTISLNESPCRTAFNGISLEICGDEPDNNVINGSIYFLSNILPF